MNTILLSIKPEYANRILEGTKKYEFRKHLAQSAITRILIYSSSPEKRIVGEVEVVGTLTMKKTPLWEFTKKSAGISRKMFREYFWGCSLAHAYQLGKAIRYDKPKNLTDYGIVQAPQSFIYLKNSDNP
jgi:predicted transcriptional regulator